LCVFDIEDARIKVSVGVPTNLTRGVLTLGCSYQFNKMSNNKEKIMCNKINVILGPCGTS